MPHSAVIILKATVIFNMDRSRVEVFMAGMQGGRNLKMSPGRKQYTNSGIGTLLLKWVDLKEKQKDHLQEH